MNKIINNILDILENNGYEAYIVGGYVRDFILGIDTTDIDICTNAKVVEVMELLKEFHPNSDKYGSVKINTNNYKIDITTYRREFNYKDDRKFLEVEYVDNLVEDIKRRDFTCNTLCMSKSGEIIDLLEGRKDIDNKVIRCVGDIDQKLQEDPLRILRAVRFASCLDFKIEDNLYKALKKYGKLVSKLSMTRIKEELNKILVNKNALSGLNYLRDLNLLDYVGIDYDRIVFVSDICGMYSQLELKKEFPFSKEEKDNIKNIKNILIYGKIDKDILFDYGLYISIVAGSIMGVSKEEISEMNNAMEIKSLKDIDISSDEICEILDIRPSKTIREVYIVLKENILNNSIRNENNDLKEFISSNREKWLS